MNIEKLKKDNEETRGISMKLDLKWYTFMKEQNLNPRLVLIWALEQIQGELHRPEQGRDASHS